jgi:hypothetical protein
VFAVAPAGNIGGFTPGDVFVPYRLSASRLRLGAAARRDALPPDEPKNGETMRDLAQTSYGYDHWYKPGGRLDPDNPTPSIDEVLGLFNLIDQAKVMATLRRVNPLAVLDNYINEFAFSFAFTGVV